MFLLHTARAKSQKPLEILSFGADIILRYSSHFTVLNRSFQTLKHVECFAEINSIYSGDFLYVHLKNRIILGFSSDYEIVVKQVIANKPGIKVNAEDLIMDDNITMNKRDSCKNKEKGNSHNTCDILSTENTIKTPTIVSIDSTIFILQTGVINMLRGDFNVKCTIPYYDYTSLCNNLYVLSRDKLFVFTFCKIVKIFNISGYKITSLEHNLIIASNTNIYLFSIERACVISNLEFVKKILYFVNDKTGKEVICVSTDENGSVAYYSLFVKCEALSISRITLDCCFDSFIAIGNIFIGLHDNELLTVNKNNEFGKRRRLFCSTDISKPADDKETAYIKFDKRKYLKKKYLNYDSVEYNSWLAIKPTSMGQSVELENTGNSTSKNNYKQDHYYIPGISETLQYDNSEWVLYTEPDKSTICNSFKDISFCFTDNIVDFKIKDNLIIYQTGPRMIKLFCMSSSTVKFIQCFIDDIVSIYLDEVLVVYFHSIFRVYYVLSDSLSYCFKEGVIAKKEDRASLDEADGFTANGVKQNRSDGIENYSITYEYCGIVSDDDVKSEGHQNIDKDIIVTNYALFVNMKIFSRYFYRCQKGKPCHIPLVVIENDYKVFLNNENELVVETSERKFTRSLHFKPTAILVFNNLIFVGFLDCLRIYKLGKFNILRSVVLNIKKSTDFIRLNNFVIVNNADNQFYLIKDKIIVFTGDDRVESACMFEECLVLGFYKGRINVYSLDDFSNLCSIFIGAIPIMIRVYQSKNREDTVLFYFCSNGSIGEFVKIESTVNILHDISVQPYSYITGQFGVYDRNSIIARFDSNRKYIHNYTEVYKVLRELNN